VVQIDGLVLLKIIQHASQHFPEYVAGSLLGLDVDHTVEVTHRCVLCCSIDRWTWHARRKQGFGARRTILGINGGFRGPVRRDPAADGMRIRLSGGRYRGPNAPVHSFADN
jgi:hypothetical protein